MVRTQGLLYIRRDGGSIRCYLYKGLGFALVQTYKCAESGALQEAFEFSFGIMH
jgi:hypothetical protein